MRSTREQAADNRIRILEAASRLFRERGYAGIGIDGIMREAGLTHGGFYKHFKSKEDLQVQATSYALGQTLKRLGASGSLQEHVDLYLSSSHRDTPGNGCALAALGGEAAREGDALKQMVEHHVANHLSLLGSSSDALERDRGGTLNALSTMVGALVLSRAVGPDLSDEILSAARSAMEKLVGTHDLPGHPVCQSVI